MIIEDILTVVVQLLAWSLVGYLIAPLARYWRARGTARRLVADIRRTIASGGSATVGYPGGQVTVRNRGDIVKLSAALDALPPEQLP